jgi:hypothetical protein
LVHIQPHVNSLLIDNIKPLIDPLHRQLGLIVIDVLSNRLIQCVIGRTVVINLNAWLNTINFLGLTDILLIDLSHFGGCSLQF